MRTLGRSEPFLARHSAPLSRADGVRFRPCGWASLRAGDSRVVGRRQGFRSALARACCCRAGRARSHEQPAKLAPPPSRPCPGTAAFWRHRSSQSRSHPIPRHHFDRIAARVVIRARRPTRHRPPATAFRLRAFTEPATTASACHIARHTPGQRDFDTVQPDGRRHHRSGQFGFRVVELQPRCQPHRQGMQMTVARKTMPLNGSGVTAPQPQTVRLSAMTSSTRTAFSHAVCCCCPARHDRTTSCDLIPIYYLPKNKNASLNCRLS